MKVISPFGPKIGRFKLSNRVIKKINTEVERVLKKKSLYKKLNYSKQLVGQVKQEFQLPKEFIQKFLHKIIEKEVKFFIHKVTNKKVQKVKILNFWIVRQYKNEYTSLADCYAQVEQILNAGPAAAEIAAGAQQQQQMM